MGQQTGTILEIHSEEVINENLTKRRFVIEEDGRYKNKICFELMNDRTDLIDPYQVGDKINVSYNLKSHEHNSKWYSQIMAWKIERI